MCARAAYSIQCACDIKSSGLWPLGLTSQAHCISYTATITYTTYCLSWSKSKDWYCNHMPIFGVTSLSQCSFELCNLHAYSFPGPSNPKYSRTTIEFTTLLKELCSKVSADWEDIGLLLKIEGGLLSAIKSDHQQSQKCFREMLKLWLKQVDPCPTWSAIIEAIEVLEYKSLAKRLRKKYCN